MEIPKFNGLDVAVAVALAVIVKELVEIVLTVVPTGIPLPETYIPTVIPVMLVTAVTVGDPLVIVPVVELELSPDKICKAASLPVVLFDLEIAPEPTPVEDVAEV